MIRTKPPSDKYRDEWDRIFGEAPAACADPSKVVVRHRDGTFTVHDAEPIATDLSSVFSKP